MATVHEVRAYIRTQVRSKLMFALAHTYDQMIPFRQAYERNPYKKLVASDLHELEAILSYLHARLQRAAEAILSIPESTMERALGVKGAGRMFRTADVLMEGVPEGRNKSAGVSLTLHRLATGSLKAFNEENPPGALAALFGDPRFKTVALRRGVYTWIKFTLNRATQDMFKALNHVRVMKLKLTEKETDTYLDPDPLKEGIREAVRDQANKKAAETGRYVDVVAPTGLVLYTADPTIGNLFIGRTSLKSATKPVTISEEYVTEHPRGLQFAPESRSTKGKPAKFTKEEYDELFATALARKAASETQAIPNSGLSEELLMHALWQTA